MSVSIDLTELRERISVALNKRWNLTVGESKRALDEILSPYLSKEAESAAKQEQGEQEMTLRQHFRLRGESMTQWAYEILTAEHVFSRLSDGERFALTDSLMSEAGFVAAGEAVASDPAADNAAGVADSKAGTGPGANEAKATDQASEVPGSLSLETKLRRVAYLTKLRGENSEALVLLQIRAGAGAPLLETYAAAADVDDGVDFVMREAVESVSKSYQTDMVSQIHAYLKKRIAGIDEELAPLLRSTAHALQNG